MKSWFSCLPLYSFQQFSPWEPLVTDDPFPTLLVEALNLVHPRFAAGNGLAYSPSEVDGPAAIRKDREWPFLMEFYHQFRRLWDKALPVQLGLGHIVTQADPDSPPGRQPDLIFWQLGERGLPDRRLGVVSLVYLSNPETLAAELLVLARFRSTPGYPNAVCIVVGQSAEIPESGLPQADGVVQVFFDTDRWAAVKV